MKKIILNQQIKNLYKGDIPNQNQLINPSNNLINQALKKIEINTSSVAILKTWLYIFDLGVKYDKKMIDAQIQAVENVLFKIKYFGGYLFWNLSNYYFDL